MRAQGYSSFDSTEFFGPTQLSEAQKPGSRKRPTLGNPAVLCAVFSSSQARKSIGNGHLSGYKQVHMWLFAFDAAAEGLKQEARGK